MVVLQSYIIYYSCKCLHLFSILCDFLISYHPYQTKSIPYYYKMQCKTGSRSTISFFFMQIRLLLRIVFEKIQLFLYLLQKSLNQRNFTFPKWPKKQQHNNFLAKIELSFICQKLFQGSHLQGKSPQYLFRCNHFFMLASL